MPRRTKEADSLGTQGQDVSNWAEFNQKLAEIRERRDLAESGLLFRGEPGSEFSLTTTLERFRPAGTTFAEYYQLIAKIKPQIESLLRTRWDLPPMSDVEQWLNNDEQFRSAICSGKIPGYAYMAYLRHHGFPSPLLDWTRSPHVASYFAFSKSLGGKVSIYVYAESKKKQTQPDHHPSVFRIGPYVSTDQRHFLQQSEYTLCLQHEDEWRFAEYRTAFAPDANQGFLWKFSLPETERLKILKMFDDYNLNAFSLFNSPESLMETLALRESFQAKH